GMADQQWMQMSKAWTDCMNRGGGESCGPAPQPPAPPPPPKQTDYRCVQKCTAEGNMQGLCVSRCSW
ncbi:MAG: hypothetical protein KGL39_53625, partial [Patescibacteria group bacterium]|nr:hypothetical protein [Patescibacteria group bacterium]